MDLFIWQKKGEICDWIGAKSEKEREGMKAGTQDKISWLW